MKPILFNTDMVRAILDGRKTVTRRSCKIEINDHEAVKHNRCVRAEYPAKNMNGVCVNFLDANGFYVGAANPQYHSGDILYVRETWHKDVGRYMFKANYSDTEKFFRDGKEVQIKWRPSIHMPKEAARLFLLVTDVRVERLLTPFFADGAAVLALKKEGMMLPPECVGCIGNYGTPACVDAGDDSECGILDEIRGDFSELWDSTIKPSDRETYGWSANPWVWVIEFERISRDAALKGGDAG